MCTNAHPRHRHNCAILGKRACTCLSLVVHSSWYSMQMISLGALRCPAAALASVPFQLPQLRPSQRWYCQERHLFLRTRGSLLVFGVSLLIKIVLCVLYVSPIELNHPEIPSRDPVWCRRSLTLNCQYAPQTV